MVILAIVILNAALNAEAVSRFAIVNMVLSVTLRLSLVPSRSKTFAALTIRIVPAVIYALRWAVPV